MNSPKSSPADRQTTPFTSGQSEMPFSDDAEKGVLSCFLQNPEELLDDAATTLRPEAFYHPANRTLFEALQDMHLRRMPIDLGLVNSHLMDKNLLDKVGGPGAVAELYSFVPIPAHYGHYKGIVQDKFLLRSVIAAATETIQEAYQYQEDIPALITRAEGRMFDILSSAQTRDLKGTGSITAKQAANEWFDYIERQMANKGKIVGLQTGWADVDRTLWGLDDENGELLTLAGRPGGGKTAAGVCIVENFASLQNLPGVVFSQEMSINQWLSRQILGTEGIDTQKAQTGMFSREETRRISAAVLRFGRSPVIYNGNPELNTATLRTEVQKLKRKHGIRWILVDHLHLVHPVGKEASKDERIRLVQTMETLHFLKKKFNLVVILLVQMNRETDKNKGQLPVLADLSGSAAIEQFSDHVIFIHRPVYLTPWKDLREEQQNQFLKAIRQQRQKHPELWSDGQQCKKEFDDEGNLISGLTSLAREAHHQKWRDEQDWNEHALFVVRKNRRGPTPDIFMRFQREFTRFSSRTPAVFSNNAADRQVKPDGQ